MICYSRGKKQINDTIQHVKTKVISPKRPMCSQLLLGHKNRKFRIKSKNENRRNSEEMSPKFLALQDSMGLGCLKL